MTDYKKLYNELLKAEELPEHFVGNWEDDNREFIRTHEILEDIILKQTYDITDEEEQDEDIY